MGRVKRLKERTETPRNEAPRGTISIAPVHSPAGRRAIGDLFRDRITGVEKDRDVVFPMQGLAAALAPLGVSVAQFDLVQLAARIPSGTTVGGLQSHLPLSFIRIAADPVALSIKHDVRLLEHLAVARTHERQGVARLLIEEGAQRHAAAGATQWVGGVHREQLEALDFYRSVGFDVLDHFRDLPPPMSDIRIRRSQQRELFWIHRWLN